jgi:hypothetical protein
MYWGGQGYHMVVANRVSQTSPILQGEPLTYINSVAVAPSGKVYFTSSGHIAPPMHKGVYNTKMGSGYIALEVCCPKLLLLICALATYQCKGHSMQLQRHSMLRRVAIARAWAERSA